MTGRRSAAGLSPDVLPEDSQEVSPLLSILDDRCHVVCPGHVSGDEDAKKQEAVDPLHTLAVDVEGIWVSAVLPEVDDELLGFLGYALNTRLQINV